MTESNIYFLFFPIYIVICIVIWCITVFIISIISGWQKAAKIYAKTNQKADTLHHFCSARIKIANYGYILTFGTNKEGIILRTALPFRMGHKPLFIPFRDITTSEQMRLNVKTIVLSFKTQKNFTIELTEKLAKQILPDSLLQN